jgi:hypothetical protein
VPPFTVSGPRCRVRVNAGRGSAFSFKDRGMHTLKGVPDAWHLYAVMN